jgi:hypothetical protein
VFEERGLRPPATWHEYLHLAGQLDGASMRVSPDTNSTIAGWCESFPTGCSYDGITLASIWTSFVARQGPQGGAFFDPQVRRAAALAPGLTGQPLLTRLLGDVLSMRLQNPCCWTEAT